jgi:hypothetical protein
MNRLKRLVSFYKEDNGFVLKRGKERANGLVFLDLCNEKTRIFWLTRHSKEKKPRIWQVFGKNVLLFQTNRHNSHYIVRE